MKYLIGTDIGTSGTKSILMGEDGRLLASSIKEYQVCTPKALWAEQWPDVWVDAVKETIRKVVEKGGIGKEEVAGICISGLYGGSGIPLNEEMEPVYPCLIWMDRRAQEESRLVEERIGNKAMFEETWNGLDPYYGYTKILWIKNNEPDIWEKIHIFLPPNAYAIYCLTGEIAMDYSSAGNLGGIFDMRRRRWSEGMMEKLGIPMSMMPERLVSSEEIVGGLKEETARELGLLAGTPICAGGVDCTVATLGLGVLNPGQQVAVIGTSMTWGYVHKGDKRSENLITMPYVKNPSELLFTFGGAATAGALIRWFRDNFGAMELEMQKMGEKSAYAMLDEEAEDVPAGSEGLLVLPFFMGERAPVWNVDARGTVFGLTLKHTRAHVYRAFLESVAYSLLFSMENAGGNGELESALILAGGVAKSKLWKQIFADVTGCAVMTPENDVEANLGDVILAGVGCGLFSYDVAKQWQIMGEEIWPDEKCHKIYRRYYSQYKNLYRSLEFNMKEMAALTR